MTGPDVAELGLQIDSAPLKAGIDNLGVLRSVAARTGETFDQVQKRFTAATASLQQNAGATKQNATATAQASAEMARHVVANDNVRRASDAATSSGLSQRQMFRLLAREAALTGGPLGDLISRFGTLSIGGSRLGVGITVLTVGFGTLAAVAAKGVQAFAEFETKQAQMGNAVALLAGGSGQSAQSLEALANQLSDTGRVSRDTAVEAEKALIVFKRIGPEAFGPALEAARALSETGLIKMADASKILGKALNDPVNASQVLGDAFVSLSTAQQQAITAAARAGDIYRAQGLILDAVGEKTNRTSSTSKTLAAEWTRAKDSFTQFMESVGGAISVLTNLADKLDRIGRVMKAISDFIRDSEATTQLRPGQTTPGGVTRVTVGATNFAPSTMSEATFRPIIQGLEEQAAAQQIAARASTMAAGAAAAYTVAETERQKAVRASTPLDADQAAELDKVAAKLGKATDTIARNQLAFQLKLESGAARGIFTDEDVQIAQRLVPLYGQNIPAALGSTEAATMRVNDALKQVKDIGGTFASGFFTDLSHGVSAVDSLRNALTRLSDTLIDVASRRLFASALGGGATAFGFHSGGIVGQGGTPRFVDPQMFLHAPRLHSGLAADEFPAIFQRGERVIPKSGGQGGQININSTYTIAGAVDKKELAAAIEQSHTKAVQQAIAIATKGVPTRLNQARQLGS
jgi:hypothetical protein